MKGRFLQLSLDGCRTAPLASHLASLGLLRAVSRLLEPQAAGQWSQQRFVLHSGYGRVDDLAEALLAKFEPEAVVSPWNAGSGFAGTGKSPTAEQAVQWVRQNDDPRLAVLREAVTAADDVVEQTRGWDLKKRKNDLLRLCRNRFPDRALTWLDAALVLDQQGEPVYGRLLGTGGNLGRLDLSATYLQHVRTVLTERRSRDWLIAALSGRHAKLPKATLGQYDPASAGNSEDPREVGNPWTFLLLIEGALLFATALVRRQGAGYSRPALPFQVRGSSAGLPTAADGENVMAEIWLPEWERPAGLTELAHLFGEARIEWNNRPARSGLDTARAIATLGVDRGITAFTRHVFVERLGRSPAAVPVVRMEVAERGDARLLTDLDSWLGKLRRVSLPAQVAVRVRATEQAIYDHACRGTAEDLAEIFTAVGRCHEAVGHSGSLREHVPPLVIGVSRDPQRQPGKKILERLRSIGRSDTELCLALGLATLHDPAGPLSLGGLRKLLTPVTGNPATDRLPRWDDRSRRITLATGLFPALLSAARRRAFPRAIPEINTDLRPAAGGPRIAFQRGMLLKPFDAQTLAVSTLDTERLTALLAGLLCVVWGKHDDDQLPDAKVIHDPAIDLLLPFAGAEPLRIPSEDGARREVLIRPGFDWPALLAAGRTDAVLHDAAFRLRLAGIKHVVAPASTDLDGTRLAALLLIRLSTNDRLAALGRVAALPSRNSAQSKETIAS